LQQDREELSFEREKKKKDFCGGEIALLFSGKFHIVKLKNKCDPDW